MQSHSYYTVVLVNHIWNTMLQRSIHGKPVRYLVPGVEHKLVKLQRCKHIITKTKLTASHIVNNCILVYLECVFRENLLRKLHLRIQFTSRVKFNIVTKNAPCLYDFPFSLSPRITTEI